MLFTTQEDVERFKLHAQLACLYGETKGVRRKGGSMYAYVKATYGFRGNKQSVYEQFKALIDGK